MNQDRRHAIVLRIIHSFIEVEATTREVRALKRRDLIYFDHGYGCYVPTDSDCWSEVNLYLHERRTAIEPAAAATAKVGAQ